MFWRILKWLTCCDDADEEPQAEWSDPPPASKSWPAWLYKNEGD